MNKQIPGIHHVTAIASDPQRNVDFYTHTLGLRLVKLTVNFDDPTTYHLYFGDEQGSPGTLLTFFPWPGAVRGRRGTGQVAATSFAVPEGALDFWEDRLRQRDVAFLKRQRRFDEEFLSFLDPDWMQLELVARPGADAGAPWEGGGIPLDYAIRGFDGVTMWEEDLTPSLDLLTGTMGFEQVGEEGPRIRLRAASDDNGALIDLLHLPGQERGSDGAGTVHHVAWRTPNDTEQLAWREEIATLGLRVTPVVDRQYFRSIYFREPGGVLFEIATDPPGMGWDEPVEALGTRLRLPSWLEPQRAKVESALPALVLPGNGRDG
ncbi:MAG: ring-cleaving dioxygenase [Anaerolineae bacterium]|jgi:glyoxalase family protein